MFALPKEIRHETSPPHIFASGHRRCRAAGPRPRYLGASLSVAAGHVGRRLRPRRRATLYGNLKFDFIRDTVPVGGVARSPHVVVITPSFPAKTVPEVNMGSPGTGSGGHLAGELFKYVAGVDLTHSLYRRHVAPNRNPMPTASARVV